MLEVEFHYIVAFEDWIFFSRKRFQSRGRKTSKKDLR